MPHTSSPIADVSPCLYYDDPAAAIDWLCTAFGLRRRLIVYGVADRIEHSELTLGDTVIMVGDVARRSGQSSQRKLPGAAHGLSVAVADPDAHCATARAAGARIIDELKDAEHGGRGYEVEDLEGHRWYFGSYRPGSYWNADGTPAIIRHG
jgi:uncharacterized glyoxalase superfamily protein PhnB